MSKEIVEMFFKKGHLLTPEALEYLKSLPADNVKRLASMKYGEIVVDAEQLKDSSIMVREIKVFKSISRDMNVDDFVEFYSTRFSKIRDIIMSRHNEKFVSISNLSTRPKEAAIIGMVKDRKEKDGKIVLEVEDMSGKTKVVIEKGDAEIDDVLGFKGIVGNKSLIAKTIIYPDVPIREPATGKGKFLFISDPHFDEAPAEDIEKLMSLVDRLGLPVFVVGDIGDRKYIESMGESTAVFVIPGESDNPEYPSEPLEFKSPNVYSFSNPAVVEVNGLKILMVHKFDKSMLRKRYLGGKPFKGGDMVLDVVPDIVHFGHTHVPEVFNYKSVTAVNSGSLIGEFKPVVIDFSTREVSQLGGDWDKAEIPGA